MLRINPNPTPCHSCVFCRPDFCQGQKRLWGCSSICNLQCDKSHCDYTCSCRPAEFSRRWREVGGLDVPQPSPLLAPSAINWPDYLPLIQHGSRFEHLFEAPFAAIPTFRALATSKRKQLDATGLRRRFKLRDDTKIMAVSVAQDPPLELYWRYRNRNGFDLPRRIADWGISAITVPNFSYFTDAPPLHTYWNFRRMLLVAEEFSNAGVAIIPHVNTLEDVHRAAWASILREQPNLKWVAKEFQTGSKQQDVGQLAFEDLCRLQDDVGFALHPIIIGGARMWRQLKSEFESFTVVDSRPFMLSVKRQEVLASPDGVVRHQPHPLPPGTALDALWRLNLERYTNTIANRESPSPRPHSLIAVSDQELEAAFPPLP